jgi:hypothetical protein
MGKSVVDSLSQASLRWDLLTLRDCAFAKMDSLGDLELRKTLLEQILKCDLIQL